MENLLLKNLQTLILLPPDNLKSLTLARSLLTNPNCSPSALRSAVETLVQALDRRRQDPAFARHVIKIMGDAAAVHRSLIPSAVQAVRPFLNADDSIAADSLAVLDSLGEYSVLSEDVVISLASSSIVSVRLRIVNILLKNLSMLRGELTMRVFLGLSTDIYPLMRKEAVDGVVELLKRDENWVDGWIAKCCYDRAVELLRDDDELVRPAAVRLTSECARQFAVLEAGGGSELMDPIFIQLSSMARDMSLKVRVEAFTALGKVRLVSEGVMLQSLSKKILGNKNGGSSLIECIVKESKWPLSTAAGAFVHGIEDEFQEVRTAACKSLGMLSKFSLQFANDALNLLMEMLNDDVAAVRLQTLQTLFEMATDDHLTVHEKHMQMFLGSLADVSAVIRHAARKVLWLMKLPTFETFKFAVDCLITNLVKHPEEEEDIFYVLFFIGKSHGCYTAKRVKEYEVEIGSFSERELSLDSPRATALLVLAVSLSFSDEQLVCDVLPAVLSCAIPLLGRISRSLKDVIQPDLLLIHLCNCSGMTLPGRTSKLKNIGLFSSAVEDGISNKKKCAVQICSSSLSVDETSEIKSKRNLFGMSKSSFSLEQSRQQESNLDESTIQAIEVIFKTMNEIWLLIQLLRTHRAQMILRTCKKELELIACNTNGYVAGLLAFALCYVEVIQLFAEIWEQLQPKHVGMTVLDLLLEKLDFCLKRMRYSFSGFSIEEECHILELTLLGYVLRAYRVGICSGTILTKLQAVFSRLVCLSKEGPLKLTDFMKELKKSYIESNTSEVPRPFPVSNLLQLFSFEQIRFSRGLKHIKAELLAIDNDSDNPLPFIPGIPVGITFQITVYNISSKNMLWLQMAVGKSFQYVFLDLSPCEGLDPERKCTVNLPFHTHPNATSFSLRACVCMECQMDGIMDSNKGQGGPRHDVTLLSNEIDVYLVQIKNT